MMKLTSFRLFKNEHLDFVQRHEFISIGSLYFVGFLVFNKGGQMRDRLVEMFTKHVKLLTTYLAIPKISLRPGSDADLFMSRTYLELST